MIGIKVSVQRPTGAGRLYPHYDRDAGILEVESRITRDWVYGADVDGIVFDLDCHRVIANCDLLIPMNRWEKNLEIEWPKEISSGDITFSKDAVAHKSFDLPVAVRSDHTGRFARIEIGKALPNDLIALSDRCIAMLAGDELVGLLVRDFQVASPD